jgi:hypothetical protein
MNADPKVNWYQLAQKKYGQSGGLKLDQDETRIVKTGRGVIQGCCLSLILFILYSMYLTMETLEGCG